MVATIVVPVLLIAGGFTPIASKAIFRAQFEKSKASAQSIPASPRSISVIFYTEICNMQINGAEPLSKPLQSSLSPLQCPNYIIGVYTYHLNKSN